MESGSGGWRGEGSSINEGMSQRRREEVKQRGRSTHKETDKGTDRQTDRQRDRQTDRQTKRQTDRQTDKGQTKGQTDRQRDRQTDRQTKGQTDRQGYTIETEILQYIVPCFKYARHVVEVLSTHWDGFRGDDKGLDTLPRYKGLLGHAPCPSPTTSTPRVFQTLEEACLPLLVGRAMGEGVDLGGWAEAQLVVWGHFGRRL